MRRALVILLLFAGVPGCGDSGGSSAREPSSSTSASSLAPSTPSSTAKPNVVLVLIDTLRPDHLPCYGYGRETAPFLASLAQRSILFRRAYSASSWTAPATASLFTSLYPVQHGVLEGFFVQRSRTRKDEKQGNETVSLNQLAGAALTIPQHFAAAGWSTFGISCNVNVTSRIGFERGFQHFADLTGEQYGKGAPADLALAKLESWKDELARSAPYFLYLHFNDVHHPWRDHGVALPSGGGIEADRAMYDGEIRFVDEALRRAYKELGWSKDTLLWIVSDHGEEFEEHGQTGHGFSLYRELVQVVMLASWPERLRAPREIADDVGLVDVFPTLAELAGAPPPPEVEGRSLVPLLDGARPSELVERPLFAQRVFKKGDKELWAVVRGDWKLLVPAGTLHGAPELYDLAHDPLEQSNLAASEPAVVARLAADLEQFRARATPLATKPVDIQLQAHEVEALKSLGYVDDGK